MRLATSTEIAGWDGLVASNPDGGHYLQSKAWGEIKARWGWNPEHRILSVGPNQIAALFLRKHIFGVGHLWYCPKGPGVATKEQLADFAEQCRSLGGFLLKLEPEIPLSAEDISAVGAMRSPWDVQISRSTIVVDCQRDDDQLLASFHTKTRYNINLAKKKGVVIRPSESTEDNLSHMYDLLKSALDRAEFVVRPKSYYLDGWKSLAEAGHGQLYFAEWSGETLAGAFVATLGKKAWYKDGGSTREHREMMAPHLLHFEIIRDLRGQGIQSYDLVGIPPKEHVEDENHQLFGLYRFKSGFSSDERHFCGTLDLPLSSWRYQTWLKVGERVASRYANWRRKDGLY